MDPTGRSKALALVLGHGSKVASNDKAFPQPHRGPIEEEMAFESEKEITRTNYGNRTPAGGATNRSGEFMLVEETDLRMGTGQFEQKCESRDGTQSGTPLISLKEL